VNSIKRTLVAAALGVVFTGSVASAQQISFGLFGDMPYTSPTIPDAELKYQRLIEDMNRFDLAFGVHVGDIKAGNTLCADEVYSRNLELFNTFRAPIVYTPGDNEWTDCHRLNNGNRPPLDRLALIRSTFFSTPGSLGQLPVPLKRQPGYPENIRYITDKVLVVTVNAPGSNNNRQQIISELVAGVPRNNPYYDGDAEFTARNAANIEWLEEVFSFVAGHPAIKLVVVAFQANPFERFLETVSASNNNTYIRSGYEDLVNKLRAKALQLRDAGKYVLAVHGDTHTARIGKPLTDTYPGCDPAVLDRCVAVPVSGTIIDNFTRAEVYAQGNVHWIKVDFDASNPGALTFQAMQVPGNGTIPPLQ
jgi:hypothetical protein